MRDADNQPERRKGLIQARRQFEREELRVVVGVAIPNREAWVLNGFLPTDDREHALVADFRRELGFHPCEDADRLTATHKTDKKSAKRVLRVLVAESAEREASCWKQTPLERLVERGAETGLRDFLSEVEEVLLPLLV
ncbi:MAG: hypothetical protein GVY18_01705 [Bacteroidetes bacterium]|nr:hypothetical protein [Bacteroidota bacterium]